MPDKAQLVENLRKMRVISAVCIPNTRVAKQFLRRAEELLNVSPLPITNAVLCLVAQTSYIEKIFMRHGAN